ncbi:MAG TPA: hypothetical protein PL131_12130 [Methylotenera sp.]|nr:hypothetical protein [Methylotenera sp.]HPH06611.1 hypothetical protein [Methylotenera sp.]HPN01855.1 hypothetical protein [Methylotenera sp.]
MTATTARSLSKTQEQKKLQTPLMILVVVVVICLVLIGFAYRYSTSQQQSLQAQQGLLNSAKQHFQSAGIEKETITTYLPQYQILIDKGFVGEERRIEWVDELRAQHKKHKLFGVNYSISQQEKYQPSFASNIGGFVLNRSIMKLDLDMLHEGDILQLIESLSANNTAPFILRDCELTRLNNNSEQMSRQLVANLHATCELDWLTLHEPASSVGVAAP